MDTATGCFTAFIFICAAMIVLGLVFSFMKHILKFAIAIVANSIVGLIVLALLKLVGIAVPLSIPVILSIALFGIGGLGTILILMFYGVPIQ